MSRVRSRRLRELNGCGPFWPCLDALNSARSRRRPRANILFVLVAASERCVERGALDVPQERPRARVHRRHEVIGQRPGHAKDGGALRVEDAAVVKDGVHVEHQSDFVRYGETGRVSETEGRERAPARERARDDTPARTGARARTRRRRHGLPRPARRSGRILSRRCAPRWWRSLEGDRPALCTRPSRQRRRAPRSRAQSRA